MTSTSATLLFVYNAESGIFNTLSDIAHKMFSPETYECNLCAITHSHFSMRKPWADFLETLNASLEFLHRDELVQQYGEQNTSLPAIFLKDSNNKLSVAISADEINKYKTMEELQEAIKQALNKQQISQV